MKIQAFIAVINKLGGVSKLGGEGKVFQFLGGEKVEMIKIETHYREPLVQVRAQGKVLWMLAAALKCD